MRILVFPESFPGPITHIDCQCQDSMLHLRRDKVQPRWVTGEGVVVRAFRFNLTAYGKFYSETFKLRRTIRMTFPDGSTTEASSDIPLHRVRRLAKNRTIDCWPRLPERTRVGTTVPVWYDDASRSRIVLDLPALIHELLVAIDSEGSVLGTV